MVVTDSQMATFISPTAMVVEVLRGRDNYDDWIACMKSYLQAQDLWNIIEPTDEEGDDSKPSDQEGEEQSVESKPANEGVKASFGSKKSRVKNSAALHAIQISCSPLILSKIRHNDTAQQAWGTLASMYQQKVTDNKDSTGEMHKEGDSLIALYKHVDKGDWDSIRDHLSLHPNAKTARIRPDHGRTVLYAAVKTGNLKIVEELVKLMSNKELELKDDYGDTALCCAAFVGITEMAECMVNKNRNLVKIKNGRRVIPLVAACANNNKDMALYLYSVTPLDFLSGEDDGKLGSYFLGCAIGSEMLDIAYDFLRRFPSIATTEDYDEETPLYYLSTRSDLFPSGRELSFWEQWIYSHIGIKSMDAIDDLRLHVPDQRQSEPKKTITRVFRQLRGLVFTSLGNNIKDIYDLKQTHVSTDTILRCMFKHKPDDENQGYSYLDSDEIEKAFHKAAGNGIVEFVIEVLKACPYILYTDNDDGKHCFISAIEGRHEKLFSLFHALGPRKEEFGYYLDKNNIMLHWAAKLSCASLDSFSGAALQMQRELQWYLEVESITNPLDRCLLNEDKETPWEIFVREHKDLRVEAEKWMKEVATSCTVVGALIVTMTFAAAFTVPGGHDQNTGYPIFQNKKSFQVFLVSDAISLFSSSTSVLMFLALLTSRYAENQFHKSLPKKLIIGLSALFVSIAAMMVAFSAALAIMFNGRLGVMIPSVLFAAVPVTGFMILQFPLLVEICKSTYGPGIFNRKMKLWY